MSVEEQEAEKDTSVEDALENIRNVLLSILMVVMVTAILLGTRWGNETLCDEGWAPTYISCKPAR